MSIELLNNGDSLKLARTRKQSYFSGNTFTNLSGGDTFNYAIRVEPGESVYIHFAELIVSSVTKNSAYTITSFSGELDTITGGVAPDEDINEIFGTPSDRVLANVNEQVTYFTPFTQTVFSFIEVTQGVTQVIDNTINVTNQRDLVNQPILLKNLGVTNKYIQLVGVVTDLETSGDVSNPIDVSVGVFYSILSNTQ